MTLPRCSQGLPKQKGSGARNLPTHRLCTRIWAIYQTMLSSTREPGRGVPDAKKHTNLRSQNPQQKAQGKRDWNINIQSSTLILSTPTEALRTISSKDVFQMSTFPRYHQCSTEHDDQCRTSLEEFYPYQVSYRLSPTPSSS